MYKIKTKLSEDKDEDKNWEYVIDTEKSRIRPIHRIFMNEEEANQFIEEQLKLKPEDCKIEEIV